MIYIYIICNTNETPTFLCANNPLGRTRGCCDCMLSAAVSTTPRDSLKVSVLAYVYRHCSNKARQRNDYFAVSWKVKTK